MASKLYLFHNFDRVWAFRLSRKHKLEPDDAVDGASEPKKMKKEEEDPEIKAEIKKQNEIMYKYRDELEKNLTKAELSALIEYNKQDPPTGPSNVSNLTQTGHWRLNSC